EKIQIHLNAILQKAEDVSLIKKNPFKAVIKEKRTKYKRDSYKYDEQVTILNAIKGTKIEQEIYIYLLTGCRPNELPPNTNFDFDNNFVIINGTKNESSKYRVVDMSEEFKTYIKPYIDKGERVQVKEISNQFSIICEENGISKPSLYRLRHTFATNHFILKTPPKQVQEWMGHSSITMTMDVYTDIDRTASREKIQKLYNNFYFETK
ncbi:MAG: tyrosine-type recombinase/integrase, partial [Christensenellales bacterium]